MIITVAITVPSITVASGSPATADVSKQVNDFLLAVKDNFAQEGGETATVTTFTVA